VEPFKKCTESCPLFGVTNETPEKTNYGCYIGKTLDMVVKYGQPCKRKMNLVERLKYLKMQRELEKERDILTTKIYHLQLLIDNCGRD
jgi:hypothetical protein